MTVLVVIKKDNQICIGADTTITINGNTASADIIQNHEKIFKFKDTWFAYTGPSHSSMMLQHALEEHGDELSFNNKSEVYKSLLEIHQILKKHFFLKPENSNNNQSVEDSHLNFLLANSSGIYQILGDRFVGEIASYWAAGSGAKYALGAMHSLYSSSDDAKTIAEKAIASACSFDSYCGLPMTTHVCEIT